MSHQGICWRAPFDWKRATPDTVDRLNRLSTSKRGSPHSANAAPFYSEDLIAIPSSSLNSIPEAAEKRWAVIGRPETKAATDDRDGLTHRRTHNAPTYAKLLYSRNHAELASPCCSSGTQPSNEVRPTSDASTELNDARLTPRSTSPRAAALGSSPHRVARQSGCQILSRQFVQASPHHVLLAGVSARLPGIWWLSNPRERRLRHAPAHFPGC